ncbi:hypothetical protein K3495_g6134 [Podosphaera aphanis]|nr:hypothetical protein K3495_g6134 [Podosphaera aphanis]
MGLLSISVLSLISFLGSQILQVSATTQLPLISSAPPSSTVESALPNTIHHASQIFNTVYGATRQWSSSIHHNGMSYFPLTVPANTLFYHGRESAEPIVGIDWLAFEIEHAESFTRFHPWKGDAPTTIPPEDENIQGYLHTYRTTRPLTKLLYLDGLAAAKCNMGPLDTSDMVLLHDTDLRALPGAKEVNRVTALCALSPEIEGIVRMELGIELVLCNITDGIEHLSANQRKFVPKNESKKKYRFFVGEYARTGSQRFGGIGAGRALPDFSSMVSAYFSSMNLTNPDPHRPELPRIDSQDEENIAKIKSEVLALFGPGDRQSESVNWQGVTDMIVTRYSDRLTFLNSSDTTEEELANEIAHILEHHINYHSLNFTASEENCASHYLLPVVKTLRTSSDQLIYQAILTVMQRICRVLFQAHHDLIEPGGSRDSMQGRLAGHQRPSPSGNRKAIVQIKFDE